MDEKKLHAREFQLKGISGNVRCKLLQKWSAGKTTELSRCIFQISLKYMKLVIPEILKYFLYILVLCNFNFYLKITRPLPQQNYPHPHPPPHQNKNFGPSPSDPGMVILGYSLMIIAVFFP